MERLKGFRIDTLTPNGVASLEQAFAQEKTSDFKSVGIYKAFWKVERDADGASFLFRKAMLAAFAATAFTTPGKIRRWYERHPTELLTQFHSMMIGCGASKTDYKLSEVWR